MLALKLAAAAALMALSAILPAHSQTPAFPTKPIRIMAPFPTGLAVDVTVRLVAERMGRTLGQPVLVEARPASREASSVISLPPRRAVRTLHVGRLSSEIAKILTEPEVRERFRALGFQPVATTSAEMAALTRKELVRFRDLVKRIGITAE